MDEAPASPQGPRLEVQLHVRRRPPAGEGSWRGLGRAGWPLDRRSRSSPSRARAAPHRSPPRAPRDDDLVRPLPSTSTARRPGRSRRSVATRMHQRVVGRRRDHDHDPGAGAIRSARSGDPSGPAPASGPIRSTTASSRGPSGRGRRVRPGARHPVGVPGGQAVVLVRGGHARTVPSGGQPRIAVPLTVCDRGDLARHLRQWRDSARTSAPATDVAPMLVGWDGS